MSENDLYGSEGGAANDRPYPYLRHSENVPVPFRRRGDKEASRHFFIAASTTPLRG